MWKRRARQVSSLYIWLSLFQRHAVRERNVETGRSTKAVYVDQTSSSLMVPVLINTSSDDKFFADLKMAPFTTQHYIFVLIIEA